MAPFIEERKREAKNSEGSATPNGEKDGRILFLRGRRDGVELSKAG